LKKSSKEKNINILISIITFIIFFGGLEIIIHSFNISRQVLPAPSAILSALLKYFISDIFPHFLITLRIILLGFTIGVPIGIALAALISQFKIIEKAFSPYVISLVTTPLITLVPLFVMWFGFGENVRVLIVVLQTIPIVMLNSITGFNNIESSKLQLARSFGATRTQTFFKVIFPNATPYVFTGIKLGGIFATITTLGVEFSGAKSGLGSRIIYFSRLIETETAFSCILLIALIGITLFMVVSKIEKRIIIWRK